MKNPIHKETYNGQERMPNGSAYPLQFANDQDWLENTLFTVRNDGRLDRRVKRCESRPTWPKEPRPAAPARPWYSPRQQGGGL